MLPLIGSLTALPLVVLVLAPVFLTRHVSAGPIVLFPLRCAMHGAMNIRSRWGYLCIKLPCYVFGRWWPGYIYASPNATPWAAWWGLGRGFEQRDRARAADRRAAVRLVRRACGSFTHDEAEQLVKLIRAGQEVVITIPAPRAVDPVEYAL